MLNQITAESMNAGQMRKLTRNDYDDLPFGVIELNRDFEILTYNQSESTLARRSPGQTIGRNFFRDVAPCTAVEDFRGHIQRLMADGVVADTEARFDYVFLFQWGRRRVRIRALRGTDTCWVFVTPLASFDSDEPAAR